MNTTHQGKSFRPGYFARQLDCKPETIIRWCKPGFCWLTAPASTLSLGLKTDRPVLEKAEFGDRRPRWCQPLEVCGRPYYHRAHAAMTDLFRIFNGVGDSTVSKRITHILVPSYVAWHDTASKPEEPYSPDWGSGFCRTECHPPLAARKASEWRSSPFLASTASTASAGSVLIRAWLRTRMSVTTVSPNVATKF
jgi:hypothetical protein